MRAAEESVAASIGTPVVVAKGHTHGENAQGTKGNRHSEVGAPPSHTSRVPPRPLNVPDEQTCHVTKTHSLLIVD